jgi:hypothetical protein
MSFIGLNDEYVIEGSNGYEDALSLENVKVLIEWLNMNRPDDVEQVEDLRRVLIASLFNEEVSGNYYSTGTWYDAVYLFGPRNILIMSCDKDVNYLLDAIDNLEIEIEPRTIFQS